MKSNNPSVDIIIPVYNTNRKLLQRCLISVLKQNYDNIHIIVVDDGSSSKETLGVLAKYSNYSKIDIVRQDNSGVSIARNAGLKKSKADYVYFVDSDDYIDGHQIDYLVRIAQDRHFDIVFAGREKMDDKNYKMPFIGHPISIPDDADTIVMLAHMFVNTGVLINGMIARSISFNAELSTMGEDTQYIIEAMLIGKSYFDGHGGYYYTSNPDSITHSNNLTSIRKYLEESYLQRNSLEKMLPVSGHILDLFSYLKTLRAYNRLVGIAPLSDSKKIIEEHLLKHSIGKIKVSHIARCRILSKSEKVKVFLISKRQYLLLGCVTKILRLIKRSVQ